MRTRAKNAARALLRSAGVVPPEKPGLCTKAGQQWLRQLELPTASQQLRRDLLLEEIETLTKHIQRIEQELDRQARRSPAVALLWTVPGIGARTAEAVAAFIDDPHRLRNAKAVGRYFGVRPVPGPIGRYDPALAHHPGGRAGRPPAAGRGRLAGPSRRSPTLRAYYERTRR